MDDQLARRAQNESLFRAGNERIADHDERATLEILCECSSAECFEHVHVTRSTYERARSDPRLFIVISGHEQPDIEDVQERPDGFVIVRKRGEAAAISEERDPRA